MYLCVLIRKELCKIRDLHTPKKIYEWKSRAAFEYVSLSVSEIKLLYCALAGCTSHKTVHPEIAPCTLPINSNNKWLKARAHTGCTPPKIVHPAVEMCTPGAGCTLNFGHC